MKKSTLFLYLFAIFNLLEGGIFFIQGIYSIKHNSPMSWINKTLPSNFHYLLTFVSLILIISSLLVVFKVKRSTTIIYLINILLIIYELTTIILTSLYTNNRFSTLFLSLLIRIISLIYLTRIMTIKN